MRKKLLSTYIIILGITIIISVFLSWNKVNDYFYNQVAKESVVQIALLEQILSLEKEKAGFDYQEFAEKYGQDNLRITIIDMDGNVKGDSMSLPETMDNHKFRTEVKSALLGIPKKSLRYSETIGTFLYYYAIPYKDASFEGVLRISIPAVNIQQLIWDLVNSIFFAVFIGLVLSGVMAYLFTRRFMRPIDELTKTAKLISEGDYDQKVYVDNEDQIGELAKAFNIMTYTMRRNLYEIAARNAELEAILKSLKSGLVAIDENYNIILCNESFQKIMGIDGDIVGKLFYEVTRHKQLFNVIEKSIDENEFVVEEAKLSYANTDHVIKISATPIRSKVVHNTSKGVLILVEDITNLRHLEMVRRDFVSNVTHELKTPLTSIRGFVEALRGGAIDDHAVAIRFIDIIDIETERLTILIDDILSLSEIENMRVDMSNGTYSIAEIVNEVVAMLGGNIEDKGLQMSVNIQPDLPPLVCNRNRIKQLFINLMDNSVKYTESGFVRVDCSLSVDKNFLVIKVVDSGIGIEEIHLSRLFERFYRVDKGRSRKQGGTGLGLSIVKHIVELYQGTIDVKSTFGEGTAIKIRLPYKSD